MTIRRNALREGARDLMCVSRKWFYRVRGAEWNRERRRQNREREQTVPRKLISNEDMAGRQFTNEIKAEIRAQRLIYVIALSRHCGDLARGGITCAAFVP